MRLRLLLAPLLLASGIVLGACGSAPSCVSGATVQAQWNATPAYGTWKATPGECVTTTGLNVPHPMTIDGGSFIDPSMPDGHYLHPIIEVNRTGSVTLENLDIGGTNTTGAYSIPSVNEAGVWLASTWDVTITHVTITDTWGDGIQTFSDPPNWPVANTNVAIADVTIDTTGRQGITVGQVNGGTIANVSIHGQYFDAFDFESDLPGLGSGNVSIKGCTLGVHDFWLAIEEPLSGPVSVADCTGGGGRIDVNNPGKQPITLTNDSMVGVRMGTRPDITVEGTADLTITGCTLTRTPVSAAYANEFAPTAPPITPGGATLVNDTGFGWPLPKGTP